MSPSTPWRTVSAATPSFSVRTFDIMAISLLTKTHLRPAAWYMRGLEPFLINSREMRQNSLTTTCAQ